MNPNKSIYDDSRSNDVITGDTMSKTTPMNIRQNGSDTSIGNRYSSTPPNGFGRSLKSIHMDEIPQCVRNLISDLEFIGNTPEGQKPCISDMSYVSQDSWLGAYKRYRLGESKNTLLRFIEELVNRTKELLEIYVEKPGLMSVILRSYVSFSEGLINIRHTYSGYNGFVTKLTMIGVCIDTQLNIYGDYIPSGIREKRKCLSETLN